VRFGQLGAEGAIKPHAGIDPRTFKAAVDEAQSDLAEAKVKADNARSDAERYRAANKSSPGSISQEELNFKIDSQRYAEAQAVGAQATLDKANLDLEFTQVRAPVDGYVTNLTLRKGSHAVANQPALALVDINSYWIHGYFRETVVADIAKGNRAIVTLMSYPDRPLEGEVDSVGWGISQDDGSTGSKLLPSIAATFEWIRLAQRVPVRIHLTSPPDDVSLRVGTTASVLVMTGTGPDSDTSPVPPPPAALQ